jgi:hypothetical protein
MKFLAELDGGVGLLQKSGDRAVSISRMRRSASVSIVIV